MKNSHKAGSLRNLQQKAWSYIETLNDPDDMWSMWKHMLMQSIDKHAHSNLSGLATKRPSGQLTMCAVKCTREIS